MTGFRDSTRRFVLGGSLGTAIATVARGQSAVHVTAEAFVTWAKSAARPISDEALIHAAGDARLIAFAESMHGAHEPLALRNCMIALFAERGMIDAVALETGFIEARQLNDYVMGGTGDPVVLARTYFSWGFGQLGENVDLLRWMRRFNSERPTKKLAFVGVDIPGGKGAVLSSLSIGIQDGLTYLAATHLPESTSLAAALTPYAEGFGPPAYFKLSPDERATFVRVVDRFVAFFDHQRQALIAASSPDAFAWAQRSAVVLRQGVEMFRVWPEDNQGGTSAKGMYGTVVVRDAAMADNLLWFLDRQGPKSRVLAFAATGHLIKSTEPRTAHSGLSRLVGPDGPPPRRGLGARHDSDRHRNGRWTAGQPLRRQARSRQRGGGPG